MTSSILPLSLAQAFVAWVFGLMTWTLPPERVAAIPTIEARRETAEERAARYESIAADLVAVVFDPDERPLFAGDDGRAKTATVLLGLTRYESDWHKDVDAGLRSGRGDKGRSWCLGQVLLDDAGEKKTPEGWTGPDLVADRKKCWRVVLHRARESFAACRDLPVNERLALYARGSCDSEDGRRLSRTRMNLALALFAHKAPPKAAPVASAP